MIDLTHAFFRRLEGRGFLELQTTTGTAFCDNPAKVFLDRQFVPLWGDDVQAGKIPLETATLPPDPLQGIPHEGLEIQDATTDPRVLWLAKQMADGKLQEGEVTIPTLEQIGA